jgi:hypothetical protein
MKKDTVWLIVAIVLLIGVVTGLVWIFGGFEAKDDGGGVPQTVENEEVTDFEESQEDESNQEEETSDPNASDEEDSSETEDLSDIEVDGDVTYSTSSQSVGEDTEELFTLDDIEVTKGEEVVELLFTFAGDDVGEDSSIPVSAVNKSSLGAMEIVVSNVESDGTGMSYDQSIDINREGIAKLTKVVSGESNTLEYSLGFTDALEYYLYEPEVVDSSLVVKFSIKYPGGEISSEDLGVTEFTSEDVSVESSTAENGVRISGYTYNATGGVLRYILKTSSNTGSPIPSLEASLADGTLTVTFSSLNADITYSASDGTVSLPGGVTLNISRSGQQSVYEFVGVGSEYRVYGETSPNQVVIEVKL